MALARDDFIVTKCEKKNGCTITSVYYAKRSWKFREFSGFEVDFDVCKLGPHFPVFFCMQFVIPPEKSSVHFSVTRPTKHRFLPHYQDNISSENGGNIVLKFILIASLSRWTIFIIACACACDLSLSSSLLPCAISHLFFELSTLSREHDEMEKKEKKF